MTKTIMIVDDAASTRQLVCIVLQEAGYELTETCDGDAARSRLNERKAHLIISDVKMPDMDGTTFMEKVKNLPEHKFASIIMLTADLIKTSREQAQVADVKAWMEKPFDQYQLLEMVSHFSRP